MNKQTETIKIKGFAHQKFPVLAAWGEQHVAFVTIQGRDSLVAWDCEKNQWTLDQVLVADYLIDPHMPTTRRF